MLALLHSSESLSCLTGLVGNHGVWSAENTLLNQFESLMEYLIECVSIFFKERMIVNECERSALSEGSLVETHVISDVAQTNLDEGPEGCKKAQRGPQ